MDRNWPAKRTQHEIVRLCLAGLDSHTLRIEALRLLRKVVPVDAVFCATVDPATLLFTGSVVEAIPEEATPAFLANEFFEDDVNKFVHLAMARQPVQSLYEATRNAPERSPRYREILAPLGFGDELRAALRTGPTTWGVVCLHREVDAPGFTPAESDFLARIAPHLAQGLRTALLLEAESALVPERPGLVILADDYTIESASAIAERWIAKLGDWPRRSEPPQAIRAVAARLEALERAGEVRPEQMPRARVQARSGQWLVLHASRLSGPVGKDQIAVILEPAGAKEIAPLILQAYGLTERESQVTQLVLLGRSTDQISNQLAMAALTVQQHLKSVFDKTGVRSRRELVAQVFARHYLPGMIERPGNTH